MKVQLLGHTCFLVTADSGLKIITDPYEEGFQGLINYGAVREYIFIRGGKDRGEIGRLRFSRCHRSS